MVLKVTHLKSSGAAVGKYLRAGLDQADSKDAAEYFQAENAPTQWTGELAAELGLSGEVDADILAAALDGTLPNGEQMAKHTSRRIGEDLTFSAPKSASLAALAWGDDRVTQAHDLATADTLQWVQQNMIYARHGKGGEVREYNPKVMIALHRHIDARPAPLPDGRLFVAPQLHTHGVTPNICRRADGSLGGLQIDMGEASGLRLLADARYQADFAARLRSAGIGLRQTKNGFELADIDDETITAWSPRTQQIDNQLASQGMSRESSTEAQRQAANLKTRLTKSELTATELRAQWATTPPAQYTRPETAPPSVESLVQNAIDDAAERLAVMPIYCLTAMAIFGACAYYTAAEIEQALMRNKSIIKLDEGRRVTTTMAVKDEAYNLTMGQAYCDQSQNPMPALMDAAAIPDWIAAREQQQGFAYSPDQLRALDYLARDTHRVSLAVGSAGAGKTTAMRAIAQAAALDYDVVGLAPSHAAAQALKDAVGNQVQTVAKWISDPPKASNKPRYIICDEAGMVGTHDMAAVLRSLGPQDRILLIGDPKQLGPIAAGQPYADLLQQYPHATIEQIRRQSDEEQRDMVSAFAKGDAHTGADMLLNYVVETDDYAATLEQAATAYVTKQGSVLALASRRQTVADLSSVIRSKMQDAGKISQDIAAVPTFQKVSTTKAAMRRKPTYSQGTKLKSPKGKIYTVEAPPVIMDGQAIVTVTDDAGRRHAHKLDDLADDGWQIVSMGSLAIAQGDQLLITDTVHAKTADGKRVTLRNGQALTVQGLTNDQRVIAIMPNNQQVAIDPAQPLPLDYGWARTIHKAQGQTVDHAIVVDDGFTGGQLAYVAASRQRQSLQIYAPDAEDLAERVSDWASKASALHYEPSDTARFAAAKEAGEKEARHYVTSHTAPVTVTATAPIPAPIPAPDPVHTGYQRP